MSKKSLLYFGFFIFLGISQAQQEAPSWVDFVQKNKNNPLNQAALGDYSYKGYHFLKKS